MTARETCIAQEQELRFQSFSRRDAFKIGCMLYEESLRIGKSIAIRITVNDLTVFQLMPTGTTKNNERWLARKHNMVMARGTSSELARLDREADGRTMESMCLDPMEYSVFGGGFPIILDGSDIIGSICVSGLAGDEDHAFIVKVLKEFLK